MPFAMGIGRGRLDHLAIHGDHLMKGRQETSARRYFCPRPLDPTGNPAPIPTRLDTLTDRCHATHIMSDANESGPQDLTAGPTIRPANVRRVMLGGSTSIAMTVRLR
jgi:hypothetical protein